jgi:hypothetical protein
MINTSTSFPEGLEFGPIYREDVQGFPLSYQEIKYDHLLVHPFQFIINDHPSIPLASLKNSLNKPRIISIFFIIIFINNILVLLKKFLRVPLKI